MVNPKGFKHKIVNQNNVIIALWIIHPLLSNVNLVKDHYQCRPPMDGSVGIVHLKTQTIEPIVACVTCCEVEVEMEEEVEMDLVVVEIVIILITKAKWQLIINLHQILHWTKQ